MLAPHNRAMDATPVLLVLTTVATRGDALALAQAMVEGRFAACAQIGAIDSVYRWQGAVVQEGEFRVLFKTTAARYAALEAALRERHPYQLPAIVAVPVSEAWAPFAEWLAEDSAPPG